MHTQTLMPTPRCCGTGSPSRYKTTARSGARHQQMDPKLWNVLLTQCLRADPGCLPLMRQRMDEDTIRYQLAQAFLIFLGF